ncbi:MAG TPA: hypothetical protein VGO94_07355 [Mycobacteriales bacterium]|nr:hypothetical protein [Cryptosporangiaceae bacterium]MDQ1678128.1 hypothetical protein [Actinomycetota bacterium]HEV7755662.1 hypothetical protein [Mycobacteriales bacterium]
MLADDPTQLLEPVEEPAPGSPRAPALVALVLAVVVGVGTAADVHYPGRLPATVLFAAVVPGWSVLAYLRLPDRALAAILSVVASVAVFVLIAQGMVLAHAWRPEVAVVVLAAGSGVLLVGQLVRPRATPEPATAVRDGSASEV